MPRLRVAWFSHFPVEWLPDLPAALEGVPRMHPATWQRVLWEEFATWPNLELHILALRGTFPRSHTFQRGNTRFHCLRTLPASRAPTLYWIDTLRVRRALKKIQPDLVHAWGSEFGSAAVAGRLPYPALVTMQGILTWYGSVFPLNRHMRISRALEPGSLRRADVVTCESRFAMGYLRERYPHLKLLQVEHAPNPLFAKLPREPRTGAVKILCVASFLYWKGADVVIKALDQLKDLELEVTWIGSYHEEFARGLKAETDPATWNRIRFKGELPAADVARELAAATLFLHAARADNSPNSVKEAVVAGVPVVATRTGGIPDYVLEGKNGFLFESGDAGDCARALRAALGQENFAHGRVDPATLQEVRRYLSAGTMAEKFFAAYQVVLREDRRAR